MVSNLEQLVVAARVGKSHYGYGRLHRLEMKRRVRIHS